MANLIMRFPGGLPKALTLSYDDGVEQDEKLIEIAEKYGLKGTFNINSGCFPPEDVAVFDRILQVMSEELMPECKQP